MAGSYTWNGNSVFIVDDSPSVRKKLKNSYESLGFTICGEAGDGVEALEKLQDLKPDLLSIDMMMPVMHGVEFYRELKKDRDFKFLFVSALNTDYRTKDAFVDELDPHLFVAKPVNKTELIRSLEFVYEVTESSLESDNPREATIPVAS